MTMRFSARWQLRWRRTWRFAGILAALAATAAITGGTGYASHGGPHTGAFKTWQVFDPIASDGNLLGIFRLTEVQEDPDNMTAQLASGPLNVTAVEYERVTGHSAGLLYWNPATNQFKANLLPGEFGQAQALDINRSPIPSSGPPAFGGGDVWMTLVTEHTLWVNFRASSSFRRWSIPGHAGSSGFLGVRVNPSNGKVYVADESGSIFELNPATNAVREWTITTGSPDPLRLVIDPAGLVYATLGDGFGLLPDQIVRLDPQTNAVTRWQLPGSNGMGHEDGYFVRDAEGQLWFTEPFSNEVGRLNPVTNVFEEFAKPGIAFPSGITTMGAGPTLQAVFTEVDAGQVSVLTRAAASPTTTVVSPSVSIVTPTESTATTFDETVPPLTATIAPVTSTSTSTDPSGIDRFPVPPGTNQPTGITGGTFPQTVFGSLVRRVFQFENPVAPPTPCTIKITNGGWIVTDDIDRANFGGNAKETSSGADSGQENYLDHGPADPMDVHSIQITDITCNADLTQASIFGTATVNGTGSHAFQIDVQDNGEPGKGTDHYRMRIPDIGYDSGDHILRGGNVQIH
jgi:hypothetical protein